MKTSMFFVALASFAIVVCGAIIVLVRRNETINERAADRAQIAGEVSRLYLAYHNDQRKPPMSLEDLESYATVFPKGIDAIKCGKWVIRWGTAISPNPRGNGDRIIAHEKDLINKPSWVIRGDGSATVQSFEEVKSEQEVTATLHEIGKLYMAHLMEKGIPPVACASVEEYAQRFPKAYNAIKAGRWIVLWNKAPSNNPNESFDDLLAYEPTVMTNAGWVLTADGSGVFLTAEAFKEYKTIIPIAHQIWRLYTSYCKDQNKAPLSLGDLKPYATLYPDAFQVVKNGQWEIRWGTLIGAKHKTQALRVLAYQRDAPTTTLINGAYVITTDNLLLRMSKEEFKQTTAND